MDCQNAKPDDRVCAFRFKGRTNAALPLRVFRLDPPLGRFGAPPKSHLEPASDCFDQRGPSRDRLFEPVAS
jgi:hypothetical protein